MFAEYRLQTVCRDDVKNRPMFLWWNFREFYNLKFKNNRNTKGLLTLAGMPKDTFFLFQSFLNPARPVVHLCGRRHFLRAFAADNGIKACSNAKELQLTLNGAPRGKISNGSYRIPDSAMKMKNGTVRPVPGIPVANVFFWKTPLKPGRNVVEVNDGRGHGDRMIIYQTPANAPDPAALVQDLQSSNPGNSACFIDRPVESQGPVYTDVDGSSDNTFDVLPNEVEGADWIATRRLSDPRLKTDLEFRINPSAKGATVFVLFSTGAYPTVTLKQPDPAIASAAPDAPLKPEELDKASLLIQFPVVMGGVVPVINVAGIKAGELKLRRMCWRTSSSGKIKKWNDPRLEQSNPGLKLPQHGGDRGAPVGRLRYDLGSSRTMWPRSVPNGPRPSAATNQLHGRPEWGARGSGRGFVRSANQRRHWLRRIGLCHPESHGPRQAEEPRRQIRRSHG